MKKKMLFIIPIFSVCIIGTAFRFIYQPKPWNVPDKYVKMINPVKADAKSINAGKSLYSVNCQDCHGKKGLGDGTKAPDLKTQPGDLVNKAFQYQTDGSIFYKISQGRNEMPSAKKDYPDDVDRWNLVNYLRTLAKK